VSSARMVSKTKTCGRSDEQHLDLDVFFYRRPLAVARKFSDLILVPFRQLKKKKH
jgi:hypothetical protein